MMHQTKIMAIIIYIITWPKMASPDMHYHAIHPREPFRVLRDGQLAALIDIEVSLNRCEISHDPVISPISYGHLSLNSIEFGIKSDRPF